MRNNKATLGEEGRGEISALTQVSDVPALEMGPMTVQLRSSCQWQKPGYSPLPTGLVKCHSHLGDWCS